MPEPDHAIFLSFDDTYLPFAKACLNSLEHNFPDHPRLIVNYQVDNSHAHDLIARHGAERLPPVPPPEYAKYLLLARAGASVLDRLGLWRHCFDRFDTILHLDVDVLVLKPLTDLFEVSEPYFVANAEPSPEARLFSARATRDPALHARLKADGLVLPDRPEDMANAGVFSLPRAWRSRAQVANLARLAQRYGRFFSFADQSLISLWLLLQGLRPNLQFRDNFQTPMLTDPDKTLSFDDIRVLHFSSFRKPGTAVFDRWERVGQHKDRILSLWTSYSNGKHP